MKYNVSVTDLYRGETLIESSVTRFSGLAVLLFNLAELKQDQRVPYYKELAELGSVRIIASKRGGAEYQFDISEIDEKKPTSIVEEPKLFITLWHRVSKEELVSKNLITREDATAMLAQYVGGPIERINKKLDSLVKGDGGYAHFLSFDFPDGAYSGTVQMKVV